MLGYDEYSAFREDSLRRGNVHKNALAKRHAICCWLNDTDLFWLRFNNGIELGRISGNCNANPIISGSILLKNVLASWSSSS